jgi:hypothetical protein
MSSVERLMKRGSFGPASADKDKAAKAATNTALIDFKNIYFSKKIC